MFNLTVSVLIYYICVDSVCVDYITSVLSVFVLIYYICVDSVPASGRRHRPGV